jgi:tetratricopeptide (TPR) repeat protein
MRSPPLLGAFGVAIALAVSIPAAAQNKDPAHARELYEDGARLYNLGQYENALHAFEQAYAISGAKPLLFNIAQAHRLAGPAHCERALSAYETYLREDPQTSNRIEVEQRIGEMRVCAEHERANQAAPTAVPRTPANGEPAKGESPAPAEERTPPAANMAPIVLTGVGAVLAATGGLLYWQARVKFDHVQGSCPCPDGEFSGWQTATYTSYALLAAGGATLAGGVAWWILDRRQSAQRSYGVVVQPAGVFLVGAF